MRVLITGGSGFLGTGLVEKLLRDPEVERICIYSRGEHRQAEMMEQFSDPRLRPFIGDVRDRDRLERALHGVDTVIHAAAGDLRFPNRELIENEIALQHYTGEIHRLSLH